MNETTIVNIIVYSVVFVIAVAITRAVFSIGTIVRHLKAQTLILSMLAEKSGIDSNELKAITDKADKIEPTKYSTI